MWLSRVRLRVAAAQRQQNSTTASLLQASATALPNSAGRRTSFSGAACSCLLPSSAGALAGQTTTFRPVMATTPRTALLYCNDPGQSMKHFYSVSQPIAGL